MYRKLSINGSTRYSGKPHSVDPDKPSLTIREDFEEREANFISPYGMLSARSRGRMRPEEPCPVRTVYQQDRDRIVFSNAFRRLKHKTQVFLSPLGDHYRTRLTHTLEVAEIARTISRALRLNEDLTEAIAMGHDMGHTPFGHSGETALKEAFSPDFCHNEQSLRVIDVLERHGRGLNLTYEVRDGILKHSKGFGAIMPSDPSEIACTLEGRIVRFADIIAYLNHDLDDAIRSGVVAAGQVPAECVEVLGRSHSQRTTTMIRDLIYSSEPQGDDFVLQLSEPVSAAMNCLRIFLYDNVYRSEKVHAEFIKAKRMIIEIYRYFLKNPEIMKSRLASLEMATEYYRDASTERLICDFIASMTDRYVLNLYNDLFVPTPLV